jgi:hypothetical protein
MSFQWVIDSAEQLSINRVQTAGSTIARDGRYRAVQRGANPYIFTVKLPDGPRWSEIYTYIEAIEALGTYTAETGVQIKYSKFPWYYGNVAPASNDSYDLICVTMPNWNIFARDQVSWSGPFVFVEDIV